MFMRKFFHNISFMGLKEAKITFDNRGIVMANRLNLAMLILMILICIVNLIMFFVTKIPMSFGIVKIFIIIAINLTNIWLVYKRYFLVFKISLIYIPTFIFFVLPSLVGFLEEEGFYYFPFVIVALSLIPQLIWVHGKEYFLIICSLIYYLLLVILADYLLSWFAQEEFLTSTIIKDFYVYYKMAPIAIFLFLHISIYYLRNLNYTYEKEISEYNQELNSTVEELKTTQQHLIQAEKMASLGTLTSGVAHEINNPLNYIFGGVEMINEIRQEVKEFMTDEQKDRCEEANNLVKSGFERVSGIVKALMNFSYSGQPKLIKSDINDVIEDTLLFLSSKIADDLVIEKHFLFKDEIPIYREKIHQVIINLLNNALDAVNEKKEGKKKIVIASRKEVDNLVIEISNNGAQIPEEHLSQIFDPFFTTKDPGKGVGLGLSICYSLIKDHNGKIEVMNTEEGVSSIVMIPVDL